MTLDKNVIDGYANSRSGTYKKIICHAPFVNLNFEQNGNVRACCYNTTHVLGQWPQQTIKEIWRSESANQLRGYIKENNLGGGCTECGKMIEAGNYQGVRAKYYDEFAPNSISTRINYFKNSVSGNIPFPKVMEFELSNECNLECVMCNGYFSSSIRKNREHLPAIVSPYNDKFIDELEEFIPHLTDAKFLGGEPFMIEIYLRIWELIKKLNPNIRIHITTNGTFLNNRIKDLLEGLHAGIILSIDSVNRETYPKIRVNGNYDKVMENLEYFMSFTTRKRTFLSIAACPIIHNWQELPQMLEFCIEKNIALYFNAVFSPAEFSLREQTATYLQEVISFLENNPAPALKGNLQSPRSLSITAYNDFINLLRGWYSERKTIEAENSIPAQQNTNTNVAGYLKTGEEIDWSLEEIKSSINTLSELEIFGYEDKEKDFRAHMANLFAATPAENIAQVINCYVQWYVEKSKSTVLNGVDEKVKFIAGAIEHHPKRKEILAQISQASPAMFTQLLIQRDVQDLQSDMQKFFV